MMLIVAALAIFLLSSFFSLVLSSGYGKSNSFNSAMSILGAFTGLTGAACGIWSGGKFLPLTHKFWAHYLYLDYLSHFFLFVVFLTILFVSVYSIDYLKPYREKKSLSFFWFNFHMLSFSMCAVLLSKNAALFILFWELMAFSSYFLVMTDHKAGHVRHAGFIYLCANGIGALFLIAAFSFISDSSYSFVQTFSHSSLAFFLALAGFGLKAGFIPLHVWLPEAHPAAPGNVSALMSAAMIKMGIYGIFRALSILSPWHSSWGWTMLAIGGLSALLGLIMSLGQKEIKKVLAYSSVENIGIIMIGLGLAVLLFSLKLNELSMAAFCAVLFHVFNHSLFKSLLFMGAGSVLHAAHSGKMDELGGLAGKMPVSASAFLIGSAAAAGLPFLNGFAGEFVIYYAAFSSLQYAETSFSIFAILFLSLAGALGAASFSKMFSAVFQGRPKMKTDRKIEDPGFYMKSAMIFLSSSCLFAGLLPYFSFNFLFSGFNQGFSESRTMLDLSKILLLMSVVYAFSVFLFIILYIARKRIFSKALVSHSVTWDCGYSSEVPRAQYTGSSFSQLLTDFFGKVAGRPGACRSVNGYFPSNFSYAASSRAFFYETLYLPAAEKIKAAALRFSFIQSGNLRLYVFYIFIALAALIIWKI